LAHPESGMDLSEAARRDFQAGEGEFYVNRPGFSAGSVLPAAAAAGG
jgi:hypothetical protein